MGREAATNEKGGIRSCVCSQCCSSIIWQLGSERKQKKHKDKEEEEQVEEEEAEEPCSRVASGKCLGKQY